jgi:hypothetical protein
VPAPSQFAVDLGSASLGDTLNFTGTANSDSFTITPGAGDGSGTAVVALDSSPVTTVAYVNTESISIQGGGGAAADTLKLNGTGGDNAFTLAATPGAPAGTARVDGGPTIHFADLGVSSTANVSDIVLEGGGGSDSFAINYAGGWQVDDITVAGGAPATHPGDELIVNLAGQAGTTLDVTSARSGTLNINGAATQSFFRTSSDSTRRTARTRSAHSAARRGTMSLPSAAMAAT